jgi:NAD(P)-dependent dehydrogenase (short-subunit alcohol dehydrogenase family)
MIENDTVIVTRAGSGIGFEAARALLWQGANVIIAEIKESTVKSNWE